MLSRRESDRRVPNVRRVVAGRARSGVIHVRNCEPVSRGCNEADKDRRRVWMLADATTVTGEWRLRPMVRR
jgi:hypothetical protein